MKVLLTFLCLLVVLAVGVSWGELRGQRTERYLRYKIHLLELDREALKEIINLLKQGGSNDRN